MRTRVTLLFGSLLVAASASSCFPELPDPTLVDNLRILAVQADPATANFATFPPPVITVTALVVDPGDVDLDEATHSWSLDLPDDADASELDEFVPEPPHGVQVVFDLFGTAARDEEPQDFGLVQGVLPLRYRVETPDDHREAVKLVSFFLPDLGDDDDSGNDGKSSFVPGDGAGDDDDSGDDDDFGDDDFGDDDDSAGQDPGGFPGDDDDSASDDWGGFPGGDDAEAPGEGEAEVGLDLLINDNPQIVSVQVNDGTAFVAESGELPGLMAPLFIGTVPEDGVTLTVVVNDDEDEEDLDVQLYRTVGCPNLKPEEEESGPMGRFGAADNDPGEDPCDVGDDGFFGGFRSDDDVDWTIREFAWRPLPGESSEGARLFLVLRDERGGQNWQEVRAETSPD